MSVFALAFSSSCFHHELLEVEMDVLYVSASVETRPETRTDVGGLLMLDE